jgi:predicted acetyltransferase
VNNGEDFEAWFNKISQEEKNDFPKICYCFIRKNDNKLIGMVNIRMVQDLKDYKYGHIGYSIRPTERNKGYGKIQFYLALKELEKNNITQCQMNCENNNDISRKIIQSLGGVFEKNIENEEYYTLDVVQVL